MEQIYQKLKTVCQKHSNILNVIILALFCYLFLFHNLGFYPLIDIDETRYVNMSRDMYFLRDYVTPYLNFENFLEKPPLYFWFNVVAYHLFNDTGIFVSRFSTALCAAFSVFFTYFFASSVMRSKAYGLICAFVLLSSVWFLLLSHIAILDMGFMVFSMAAIYCAIWSEFVKDENKKYCWYFAYFFMALSVLAKGLIGIIIPAMVVFLSFLAFRKTKELFKPLYIIPGILIFLLVSAPWHILVYKAHGAIWFNDYVVKHHFARFIDSSMGLGRKQPFLFYVPIVLAGIMPWTVSFISQILRGIKSAYKNFRAAKSPKVWFTSDTNDKKIILFAVIYALSTLVFFSISSSKLPTYALAIFPALALIIGYFWWGYVCFDKYIKNIEISSVITFVILIISGIIGAVLLYYPQDIMFTYMDKISVFGRFACLWLIVMPLIGVLCILGKNRALLLVSNVIFMLGVMMISTVHVLPMVASYGQDELEKYAGIAASEKSNELVTFGFARKYSLMNNFDKKIIYIINTDNNGIESFKNVLNSKKDRHVYVIVRDDAFDYLKQQAVFDNLSVVEKGKKYILLVK